MNAIIDNTGFTVYFSDRRNNRNAANLETGEYGFEDFVNPTVASGAPNAMLDVGEDINGNKILDTYGAIPNYNGVSGALPPGALTPLIGTASPTTSLTPGQAKVNRSILFRHALKLINGGDIAGLGVTGLTMVAENPVYVQGDWNANGPRAARFGTAPLFNDPHAATAIIADAVTLLSNNWNDEISFTQPYASGPQPHDRDPAPDRRGIAWRSSGERAWRSRSRPGRQPTSAPMAAPTTSCATWKTAISRSTTEARSPRSSTTGRPSAPSSAARSTRPHSETTPSTSIFSTPRKLPPNTPVFRDLNAVGFSQELRPGDD